MIKTSIYHIKKNPYLYFAFKLVVLFAIVFAFDYSIGTILRHYYFKQESGLQYRTTYSIEETKAEILIFGSSRANHHYHPVVFENRMKASYYNVGRDGNFIFYHTAVLNGVLNRYLPKVVILDFNMSEFRNSRISYDRLSSLLPYHKSHPEMRSIIELKSELEKIKLISSIYPFNSSMFTIAVGNAGFNKRRKADIQGYVPLSRAWDGSILIDSNSMYNIDSMKVKAYKSFIQNCIKSKVKLYVVCSPSYILFKNKDESVIIGKEIAKRNNIDFFDYSNDSIFINNPKLFADPFHLNDSGAIIFSNMLINSISQKDEDDSLNILTNLTKK